jgi:anti-sigma factor RsiW
MHDCSWEPLEALVMGELDAATAAGVSDHVAKCGACAQELAMLRRETTAVRSWARDGRTRVRSARARRVTWAAAACVAALALVRVHAGVSSPGAGAGRSTGADLDTFAVDEEWAACLTMTPADAPPAAMSIAGGEGVTEARFSALPPRACQ